MHGVITRVLDASYNYDIILGRDLLMDVGLVINFKTQVVKWMDHKISMRDRDNSFRTLIISLQPPLMI